MSVSLTVDTAPPANPVLLINGGASNTNGVNTLVSITHGSADVASMRIWGDVDTTYSASIKQFEADSSWVPYLQDTAVRLSAAVGRKYVYARLRDSLGNVTPVFRSYIDYDPAAPVVSMVVEPLVSRVSLATGFDSASFSWDCNVPFVEYQVRAVPTAATPRTGGSPIGSTNGSTNVAGAGSFPADTPIATVVRTADLLAASPGDSTKILKVFVRTAAGVWSP